MKFTQLAALCALASTAVFAQAKPVWQDFSVTGLYGENYAVPFAGDNNQATTATFEYAAGLKAGDVFFFVDQQWDENNDDSTYFELAPRLSLSSVTGQKLAFGPVKDVLVATTWEHNAGHGNNQEFNNFLYGVGFNLAIPYTNYATINFYKADNDLQKDDYQMTITYAVPFKIGSEEFLADAFLDWSTAEGPDHKSELNWTSQYKWNVGKHISPETKLYLGIEHSVWNNKFGTNIDQHDVSALVKYHF
ncbi:outer membrane protein OmpK [Acinetobacter pseudolwoffii]|uniref:outer membrane protein OmpK n=1 Tax=Acinetobacter pseudolwoffii TaxID=2053287 RepID=UPI0024698610|nr:outer membrane protein OmpK [Acinetobacter pseudolwoffii]MDH5820578.1 outer membrane protein OmpK [Acinetobacter pseudolwoffii]